MLFQLLATTRCRVGIRFFLSFFFEQLWESGSCKSAMAWPFCGRDIHAFLCFLHHILITYRLRTKIVYHVILSFFIDQLWEWGFCFFHLPIAYVESHKLYAKIV